MNQSQNKPLGKNKFFNIYRGKSENPYFFVLPCISISPKKNLNWEMTMFSIFFAWGKFFIQFNICEIVKNTSQEITKENLEDLYRVLKPTGLIIQDGSATLKFLSKNPFLITILKNANLQHPYIKAILADYFLNQPFITHVNNENRSSIEKTIAVKNNNDGFF